MSLQAKYQAVLNLGEELGAKDGFVKEENGVLQIGGTVHSTYEKNKEIGGDSPADIAADIRVETNDYYAKYTVKAGDTLGKIAKHFYEDAKKYPQIFNANTDILEHPDKIEVGQVLTIPFEQ
jgi:nucleoid-associated protein YgaU